MDVDGTASFTHGQPQPLFTVKGFVLPTAPYDVSNDGQRFLVNTVTDVSPGVLRVIVNWTPPSR